MALISNSVVAPKVKTFTDIVENRNSFSDKDIFKRLCKSMFYEDQLEKSRTGSFKLSMPQFQLLYSGCHNLHINKLNIFVYWTDVWMNQDI